MATKNETDREALNKLKRAFAYKLFFQQGVLPFNASLNDYYLAVSYTLRDRMQHLFINSAAAIRESKNRVVCYFSAEFLMGPHLLNNLINLGLREEFEQSATEAGLDLQQIIDHEEEPGPRQWRPWTPRRLLPGFPGQPGSTGSRLRHSLRVRHV